MATALALPSAALCLTCFLLPGYSIAPMDHPAAHSAILAAEGISHRSLCDKVCLLLVSAQHLAYFKADFQTACSLLLPYL